MWRDFNFKKFFLILDERKSESIENINASDHRGIHRNFPR